MATDVRSRDLQGRVWLNDFWGWDINHSILRAIGVAKEETARAAFIFNGVEIEVASDSDADLIYRDWRRGMSGYTDQKVGPYPAVTLTEAEIAADALVEAENEARREKADAEYREREARKKAERDVELSDAPAMTRDETKWQAGIAAQNGHGYGLGIFEYAEAWARLMQKRMAGGAKLPDIAQETSSLADKGIGITGFMYGCAVAALADAWAYGPELRRWHNAEHGITDDRPGTVNPAILTVSKPETA